MSTIVPYSLASVDMVNARLGFTTGGNTTRDQMIADILGAMTDFIEGYCGGRRFLSTSYTEVYDTYNSDKIFMRQLPVTAVSSVKYRTGLPSAPTWVTYYVDGYLAYLGAGFIRFFAEYKPFPQAFQIIYTAGYLIDFSNFNDPTKHTLPHDLTQVCIEMAVKAYTMRASQGIIREATEGQMIYYEQSAMQSVNNHKEVLNKYRLNRVAP